MKKILLLLIIIAGATQLKAQQSLLDSLNKKLSKANKELNLQQFMHGDSIVFKHLPVFPKKQFLAVTPYKLPDYNMKQLVLANIDNMPIAKVSGNIDHMPIAKVSGSIDKMPGSVIVVPKPVTP